LNIISCQSKKYSLEQMLCQIYYSLKQNIVSIMSLVVSLYPIRVYVKNGGGYAS
jgi:hypothetical protein